MVGLFCQNQYLTGKRGPTVAQQLMGDNGVLLVLVKNSIGQGGNVGTLHNAVCHSHTSGKTTWDAVNVRFLPQKNIIFVLIREVVNILRLG